MQSESHTYWILAHLKSDNVNLWVVSYSFTLSPNFILEIPNDVATYFRALTVKILQNENALSLKFYTDIQWQYFLKGTQTLLLQTSPGNLDVKVKVHILSNINQIRLDAYEQLRGYIFQIITRQKHKAMTLIGLISYRRHHTGFFVVFLPSDEEGMFSRNITRKHAFIFYILQLQGP